METDAGNRNPIGVIVHLTKLPWNLALVLSGTS